MDARGINQLIHYDTAPGSWILDLGSISETPCIQIHCVHGHVVPLTHVQPRLPTPLPKVCPSLDIPRCGARRPRMRETCHTSAH
jgi:hypothetical protein